MNIKFNEVTWYSRLAAVIVFVGLIPALTFYIGKQYGEVVAESQPIIILPSSSLASHSNPGSTADNLKYFKSIAPASNNPSNIVGYFAYGNFFLYVPQWIPDNWKMDDLPNGGMKLSLAQSIPNKDFSDILISVASTSERYNAETLYSKETSTYGKALCIADTRCEVEGSNNSIITSEILLSRVSDTRIYHIAQMLGNKIEDRFYLDGNNMTATVIFSAQKDNYWVYENVVRNFVQGIGKGEKARG